MAPTNSKENKKNISKNNKVQKMYLRKDTESRYNKNENETQKLFYIIQRHYIDGATKGKIADELGIEKSKTYTINKYLEQGKGYVRLNAPELSVLSNQLRRIIDDWYYFKNGIRSRLQRLIIAAVAKEDPNLIRLNVANLAVQYLLQENIFKKYKKFGIVGGRTLRNLIDELPYSYKKRNDKIKIYPLSVGGPPNMADVHTNCLVGNLAVKLNGTGYILSTPPLLDPNEKNEFLNRQGIKNVLDEASEIDCAIMSVGTFEEKDSTLCRYLRQYGAEEEVIIEVSDKSPGDLNYTLLDFNGEKLIHPLNERLVGVSIDTISIMSESNNKLTILLCSGETKTNILISILKKDYFNIIIIDEVLANIILEKLKSELPKKKINDS